MRALARIQLTSVLLFVFACGGEEPTNGDPTAPRVLSISPADGTSRAPISTGVWVVFSTAMDEAATQGAFTLETDDGAVAGSFEWADHSMVFTPDALLDEETEHHIRIATAAMSTDGLTLEEDVKSSFRTATDVQVTHVAPPDAARDVDTSTSVSITFSSPMDLASVEQVFELSSEAGEVSGTFEWTGDTVTFAPDDALLNATEYSVSVPRGALEAGGSAMRESFLSTFTTHRTPPEVTGNNVTDSPTWRWTAPDDATGFRYQLDGTDGLWTTVSATVSRYVPTSTLSAGEHTLFVQARYHEDAWSPDGSWTVLVGLVLHGDLELQQPEDLVGFEYIRVTGDVRVEFTPLTDLIGLESLRIIDGDINVWSNLSLNSLVGLDALEQVGGSLRLADNDPLPDLTGLGNLQKIGADLIVSNFAVGSLRGLSSLETVGGRLFVEYVGGLTDFQGLSALDSVGGDLHLLAQTIDLDGLDALRTIGGDLILDASVITSTSGLGALEIIEGNFTVNVCQVVGFDGFSRLREIGGHLQIWELSGATGIHGFDALTTIGGNLSVEMNTAVEDLDGLGAVETIGGSLYIKDNVALSSIRGLSTLDALGEDLSIEMNPSLPTCQAEELRNRLVDGGWEGASVIQGNDDNATCE